MTLPGISAHTYSARLIGAEAHDLDIKQGSVTLDERRAPHVEARVTVATRDEHVLTLLDPREGVRIELTAASTDGSARTFDLLLRERTIDHNTGDTELDLASDEALLIDDALVDDEPNTEAFDHQGSLRRIIDEVVLDRIGAHLEPGDADAPYNVLFDAENVIPNSTFDENLNGWESVRSNLARVATGMGSGSWRARITQTDTSNGTYIVQPFANRIAVEPNTRYWASAWFQASPGPIGSSYFMRLYQYNAAGTFLEAPYSEDLPLLPGQREQLGFLFTTRPDTTHVRLSIERSGVNALNTTWYVDSVMLARTDTGAPVDFFSGATPDSTEYHYEWLGTPYGSRSRRTALIDRSPETLVWKPGVSSWDFVQPLFQAAGLRLWCDEQRRWHLTDESYTVEGVVQLATGFNITSATDTISRNDSSDWCDSVLVIYRWTDEQGIEHTEYDIAGETFTRPQVIEIRRPYPGPGFASYVLSRAQGRGRVLDLGAISDYAVQPGLPAVVTLPSTPIQTGVVSSVTWDLGQDEMQVQTRGLTDTPRSAWAFLPEGESWLDSPVGASWLDELDPQPLIFPSETLFPSDDLLLKG